MSKSSDEQIGISFICEGDAEIERISSSPNSLVVSCAPLPTLLCVESQGEMVVKWRVEGETASCTDSDGAVVGEQIGCLGSFRVDRLASPIAALEAFCLPSENKSETLAFEMASSNTNNNKLVIGEERPLPTIFP
jgi:hypothetical protein